MKLYSRVGGREYWRCCLIQAFDSVMVVWQAQDAVFVLRSCFLLELGDVEEERGRA